MSEISDLEARISKLKAKKREVGDKILELEERVANLRLEDGCFEPGWYLDANGQIAHLAEDCPYFDDGWGNPWDGQRGYGLPALPLTRLVPEG